MIWFDFYRWMDGEESHLGEGMLDPRQNVLCLMFELPSMPDEHKVQHEELLCRSVSAALSGGKCRLPWFSYWIRWERKAVQQELPL